MPVSKTKMRKRARVSRTYLPVVPIHVHANHISAPSAPAAGVDAFFQSFPKFVYNSSKTPAMNFKIFMRGLPRWHDWDGSITQKEYEEAIEKRYQVALTEEFTVWFGKDDDMRSWSSLCQAVKIDPVPATIEECKKAVENRHVNIVDLVHWARKVEGAKKGENPIQIFKTVKKLADYSYDTGKVYDRKLKDGAVLKYLLRPLARAKRGMVVS